MKVLSKFGFVSLALASLTSSMVVSLAAPAPVAVAATTEPPKFTTCTNYFFYGVRGSGQNSKAIMKDGKFSAYGPQVKVVAQKVEAGLKAKNKKATIFFGYNDYPAVNVKDFFAKNVRDGSYADSVFQGANRTIVDLKAINKKCPNTKFILVGYSQGAHVLHGAAYYLSNDSRLANINSKVVNITLISDPARREGDPIARKVSFGSGTSTSGVFFNSAHQLQTKANMVGKIYTYCHLVDPICSFRPERVKNMSTHTGYYQQNAPASKMANQILTVVK